jgi:hypothetical protein
MVNENSIENAVTLGLYNGYFFIWLLVGLISTVYSFVWDVVHDWGLWQKKAVFWRLRKKITYSPTVR